jgi:hypothetical protein
MSTALGIEPDIDLEQLLRVATSDQYSVQFSPMLRGPGGEQGGTIIRSAVSWKGMTKNDNESFAEYVSRMEDVNEGVASGLRQAQEIRNAVGGLEGKDGVVLLNKDGDLYPVPQGAAELAEHQGTGNIEGRYESVNAAIDAMTAKTGDTPRFPTVY